MGVAAYNRGSRAISEAINREQRTKRTKIRCSGKMRNGPEKRYARCDTCGRIDWEANEGDRCLEWVAE